MNKNGLCREVGLIIIRFKSVKVFSQISPPGGRRLKIHLWEVYHDSELVSLETEYITAGKVCPMYINLAFIFMYNYC